MIDFVKIQTTHVDQEQLASRLEFYRPTSDQTDVGKAYREKEHLYSTITLHDDGRTVFSGSLHKLWNAMHGVKAPNHDPDKPDKGYNGNQFPLEGINQSIAYLKYLFNCPLDKMTVYVLEVGINAEINTNPKKFIKGLVYHRHETFERRRHEHTPGGTGYIPGYQQSTNSMRSTHATRTQYHRSELNKSESTIACCSRGPVKSYNLLVSRFDEVIYYDYTLNQENCAEREIRQLERYSNPHYWINELSKQQRHYHKNRLWAFIEEYSLNLHAQIKEEMNAKLWATLGGTPPSFTLPITCQSKGQKFVPITCQSRGKNLCHYFTYYLCQSEGQKKRK